MVIVGEWRLCDDGIIRPAIWVKLPAVDGAMLGEFFLIDTCADRTVLSANFLVRLRLSKTESAPGWTLQGVGGESPSVAVKTVLQLTRGDGAPVRVHGEFAAFQNPAATDLSILGRDVLDIFDVIVSKRRGEVLLLAGDHSYRIEPV